MHLTLSLNIMGKINHHFFRKFLRRGMPQEIILRATLGTHAIGSPPLALEKANMK